MPPSEKPANNPYWCAKRPMTIARIKNHQTAFKGAPSRRVPFGMHSVKYLMHLLEAACAEAGQTVEEMEAKYGNPDPPDAPWILKPRTDTWEDRMRAYARLPQCELTHARPIPYGEKGQAADVGTERYPEWEGYEEGRHEEGKRPTDPEVKDERTLREREMERLNAEAQQAAQESRSAGMDMHEETARAIENESKNHNPPDDEIERAMGGMFD